MMTKESLMNILQALKDNGYDVESFLQGSATVVSLLTSPDILERLKAAKCAEDHSNILTDIFDMLAEISVTNKQLQGIIHEIHEPKTIH